MSVRNDNKKLDVASFWKLCASDAWKESVDFAFHGRDPRWSFLNVTTSFLLCLLGLHVVGAPLDLAERMVVSLAIAGSQAVTLVVAFVINLLHAPFERWSALNKGTKELGKRRTRHRVKRSPRVRQRFGGAASRDEAS